MKKDAFLELENLESEEGGLVNYNYEQEVMEKNIYPEANVKVERSQYSIFELHRKYEKGQLILDPDFQREDVWKKDQRSELIESVLMGIPLPIFYLNETKEGKLVVIDGRQRLTTFFSYLKNEFKLKNLKILKTLNNLYLEDLEDKMVAILEDFQIIAQVIKPPTPDRIKFDIFDRVNRGGTPLNNQEMRNALYQGKSTKLLSELVKDEMFLKVTGNSINSNRMKDRYLVLRLLSFYLWKERCLIDLNGNLIEYKNDIDDFLGNAMEFLNRCTEEELYYLSNVFRKSMCNNYIIFKDKAFRRLSSSQRKNPINMILFEAFGYFSAHFETDFCKKNREILFEDCEKLLRNPNLNKLLTEDRGRGVVIHEVFNMFEYVKESYI